jgi:hypothetical protein
VRFFIYFSFHIDGASLFLSKPKKLEKAFSLRSHSVWEKDVEAARQKKASVLRAQLIAEMFHGTGETRFHFYESV